MPVKGFGNANGSVRVGTIQFFIFFQATNGSVNCFDVIVAVLEPHLMLFDILPGIPFRSYDNGYTTSKAFIHLHWKGSLADKSLDAGRKPNIRVVDIIRDLLKIDTTHEVDASIETIVGNFLSELICFWPVSDNLKPYVGDVLVLQILRIAE
jgi:hypothetical protein